MGWGGEGGVILSANCKKNQKVRVECMLLMQTPLGVKTILYVSLIQNHISSTVSLSLDMIKTMSSPDVR